MTTALKKTDSTTVVQHAEPSRLIELAITQNADIEKLERLMDLQERWNNEQARKAFYAAFAQFQADVPLISKSKTASFPTRSGGTMTYNFASLDDVVRAVTPVLSANGFSYRFEQNFSGGMVSVTCILSHALGHSESCVMSGVIDQSGNKNALQQVASTVTYLKRYSFLNVTGVSTTEDDTDGFAADIYQQQPQPQQHQAQPQQPQNSQFYSEAEFDHKVERWRKTILDGKKTAAELVAFVESRGKLLTAQQKQRLGVQA